MTARTLGYMSRSVRLAQQRTSAKKRTYFAASLIFNGALLFVALKGPGLPSVLPWQFVLLVLAVFRGSRLLAYDTVMQTYRSPFVKLTPHDSGTGDTTCARTDVAPWREVIGELICCPICNGTWWAAGLLTLLALAPTYGWWLVYALAAIGASELLMAHFENVQWQGEKARHECGPIMAANRREYGA